MCTFIWIEQHLFQSCARPGGARIVGCAADAAYLETERALRSIHGQSEVGLSHVSPLCFLNPNTESHAKQP